MNRITIHFALALLHAICSVATSPAADPTLRLDVARWQPSPTLQYGSTQQPPSALQQTSTTALAPRVSPLDTQVSDLLSSTPNRVFTPPLTTDRRSEFATLFQPLGSSAQPVSSALHTSADFSSLRTSSFAAHGSTGSFGSIQTGGNRSLTGALGGMTGSSLTPSAFSFQAR
jgi:hypothetical protein